MERTFIPLHPAQIDVYTDQLIHPDSPHYNIGGYIKLKGKLNKEKFHEAIRSIPNVFDAFRMQFPIYSGEQPASFFLIDLANTELAEMDFSNDDNPETAAKAWMQQQFNKAFQLKGESPLWENRLIKIAENEYWFYGRYHHLVTDGYGFIVLVQYIARKYKSLVEDDGCNFGYPSYSGEACIASNYLLSADYQIDKKYWVDKINVAPEKILPAKYLRLKDKENCSSTFILSIDDANKKLLDELQLKHKAGLQQLTFAALIIYFGKITGQSEFIFGSAVHKRNSKRLRNIVGMFSGILPFKGVYKEDKKLSGLIKEIMFSQRVDYRHQNFSIGDLTRSLRVKGDTGYLHEISVNYEPLFFELNFGKNIDAGIVRLANEQDLNPLQICWRDYGSNEPLQMQIHFGHEYFSQREIEFFADRLLYIFQQFADNQDSNLSSFNILPAKEKELLDRFNQTDSTIAVDKSILDLFEQQVINQPEKIAVFFEDKQITYQVLNTKANQLAHYLKSIGVNNETPVAVCIERSLEMLIAIFGIMKAGATFIPIDPEYPDERISYMLQDSGACVIVSSKKSSGKIKNSLQLTIVEVDDDKVFSTQLEDNLFLVLPGQLAYIIYTSGSTGNPKGVMIEQGSIVNLVTSMAEIVQFSSSSRFLSVTTYSFDICYLEFFMPLIFGGSLVIASGEEVINGMLLATNIKRNNVSHLQATPATWQMLLDSDWENPQNVIMLIGGEAVRYEIKEALTKKGTLYNCYGPTETTIWSVVKKMEANDKVLIGKPVSNTKVIILSTGEQQQPIGVAGEICISGAGLARGYFKMPALTQEKFKKGFFSNLPEAKLYHTGDVGRCLPDGNIECLGRLDDQVKIRGFRIELGEIETVLEQSGKLKQAVVIARDDKSNNKQLVVYVLANNHFDKQGAVEYLKSKLPAYMIPSIWVEMEKFPLTPNGKVDKKALPEPDTSKLLINSYAPPRNETERLLIDMWKHLFLIDKVGIHDNFFELGGHSLLLMRLIAAIKKRFGVTLPIKIFFELNTVEELAGYIRLCQLNAQAKSEDYESIEL